MKITRIFTAALAALGLSGAAIAAESNGHEVERHDWIFNGPFGTFIDGDHNERNSVQRGFQIYQEICASCHSLNQLSFRNLGEAGGPFASEEFANPNDNPVVMQVAANWAYQARDVDTDTGEAIERTPRVSDRFPWIFENAYQARGTLGALPPDLSLIVKARSGGADYIRAFLLGYTDHAPEGVTVGPGQYYNEAYPGNIVAMAPQLFEDRVEYADGTAATPEQMADDIVTFLAWAGDPHMEARKQLGVMVLLFLLLFSVLVYLAYRQIWENVEH